jgi:hypothetical protein
MGAWVSYGLGTENQNLPSFITICPTLAHGGLNNWGSAFLPARNQGIPLGVASQPATSAAVKYIANDRWSPSAQRLQLDLLQQLNGHHSQMLPAEPDLEAHCYLGAGVSDAKRNAAAAGSQPGNRGHSKTLRT